MILELWNKEKHRKVASPGFPLFLETLNKKNRSAHHPGGPLVAREAELGTVLSIIDAVSGGSGRLVFLAGEPGIGKTRLAGELAQLAHADGATVLYGRCDEDMGFSYQPFIDALQYFIDHGDPELLETQLGAHRGDLVRLVFVVG